MEGIFVSVVHELFHLILINIRSRYYYAKFINEEIETQES